MFKDTEGADINSGISSEDQEWDANPPSPASSGKQGRELPCRYVA